MTRIVDPDPRLLRVALTPDPAAWPRGDLAAAILADVERTPQRRGLRVPLAGWLATPQPVALTRLAALGVTLLALVAWLYLLGQRPPTPVPLSNGDVFFVRGGDLWRVAPEGGEPVRLFETPDVLEFGPIWSPTGERAILITFPGDAPRMSMDVINADGTGRRHLAGPPEHVLASFAGDPSWSPDGRFVAFVRERKGFPRVAIMDVDTGSARIIDSPWPINDPSWSPDGRWIVGHTPGDVSSTVRVVTIDAETGQTIVVHTDRGRIGRMTWLPDASAVAYAIDRPDSNELHLLRTDGALERLDTGGLQPVEALLSPDGTRIAFAAAVKHCTAAPHVMRLDGSELVRLEGESWLAGWSPDGEWVIVTTEKPFDPLVGGLVAIRPDGSERRTIVPWTNQDVALESGSGYCNRERPSFSGIGWRGVMP